MAASPGAARARWTAAAAVAAAVLAGCGDGGGTGAQAGRDAAPEARPRTTPPASGTRPPAAPSPYQPPAGIPSEGRGAADPAAVRVIRTWVRELREGDVDAAARTFADGALVQNGTPVLRLRSFQDRRLFLDLGFPCGARVAGARRARRGFTVVRFTLTQRVGGSCPGPGGGSAWAAVKVERGRITEWYRLPDPGAPVPDPPDAAPVPGEVAPPV